MVNDLLEEVSNRMGDPLSVSVEVDLLLYIKKTLEFCAADLEAHLDHEYPVEQREQYPTYARRHANDMEVVTDAKWCLDQIAKLRIIQEESSE